MDTNEIRETFLSFYEDRDHARVASAPLIPSDPTLLLTIAGMVPFKPFFLGDAEPPAPRVTSAQKCVRTNDIENVGRTTRHMSFFEMLGNFSFGDYFKREAIRWAWQLSVDGYGLEPDRIWVTIWEEDDESEQYWLEETDVVPSQIQRVGIPEGATRKDASDNFWSTGGAGPCGPCTELNYDRGPDWGEEGGPAVNGERYLEYYNLVFMQHEQDADGNVLDDLPAPSVDTGLGLERMGVLLQDVEDIFATDVFVPLLATAGELTGHTYGGTREGTDLSLRVIAEHARASVFLIADGVLPSKEGRGYVLRRLLRRVVRHARLLGSEDAVMPGMVDAVIEVMKEGYPELEKQRELVERVATAEEADFSRVIASGLAKAEEVIADAEDTFPGDVAFELHDTFGFPVDLTAEIAHDAGLALDRDRFDELMEEQRARARAAARKGGGGVPDDVYRAAADAVGSTDFLGYEQLQAESTLGALLAPGGLLDGASEGDELEVVVSRTPFYAEGGGQVGDHGIIQTDTGRLRVIDTQPAIEGVQTHRVVVEAGEVRPGQEALLTVDSDFRTATARSHSATHILHATMKEVLGDHAQQAGSLVQPGRLRFDFPHFEAVSDEQLAEIERTINGRVLRNPDVVTEVMALDEAKAAGAVANFGDKYGHVVRVVTIGDFSKELCGGTHVGTGAGVGPIYVVREESIGSNTRRVEAVTGADAHRYARSEMQVAEEVGRLLGAPTEEAVARVQSLMERLRGVEKELERVRSQALASIARSLAEDTERVDGTAVVTARVDVDDGDELRQVALETRGLLTERAVVVLGATTPDGKAVLICALTSDLVEAGVEPRPILHPAAQVVGGGAGGRGDLVQAGGRDGSKLDEALDVAARLARDAVS